MRHRLLVSLLVCAACLPGLRAQLAQPSLNITAPLSAAAADPARSASPGSGLLQVSSADRALSMGFPSLAASLYGAALEASPDAGLDRSALRLSLVTALMEDGRLEEARDQLDAFVGTRTPAWRLRSGLLNVRARRIDAARGDTSGLRPDEFSAEDRPWFLFLQGLLADASGNVDQGRELYSQAIAAADSETTRVRVSLAREQAYVQRGSGNIETLRANAERYAGLKMGFNYSKLHACALAATGKPAEGVAILQRLLQALPSTEVGELDEVRLLLGLVGGASPGSAGRLALFRLLEAGQDAERQRMALHLLAAASPPGLPGDEFARRLDELAARVPAHPILESLLLYRAQQALSARSLEEASAVARTLLDRFPASPLRLHALGILTNAAWLGGRYLTAADFAERARQEAPEGPARARLGVLVAEAWYRAGNYRNSADSYAAVLRAPPADIALGMLLFQRVQAEIDAGSDDFAAATALLDESSRLLAFNLDSEHRWQAEWNLARALQAAGRVRPAYERVSRVLSSGSPASMPPALVGRMRWLQARLAMDSGLHEKALSLAGELQASAGSLPAPLNNEIASLGALIAAQAEFRLNRAEAALATLARLRTAFPRTDAAVFSLLDEADYYVANDRVVDAQSRLRDLADQYSTTDYAPYALYRAALLAEQRGQDSSFREANSLVETLVERYPNSEFVFYARLHQGALLTRLNEFAPAEQIYEELLNKFPDHGDILSARLALADCHSAQMGVDAAHADRALELYEGLVAHPSASADMRIEAGYKWGLSYSRRGDAQRAADIWWRDVVAEFLVNPGASPAAKPGMKPAPSAPAKLGTTGRYWMARTLYELSELLARLGRTDESRRALQLIADSAATSAYAELARARLNTPSTPK